MNETTRPIRSLMFASALMLLLLSVAGTAGAYVVPTTATPAHAASAAASDPATEEPDVDSDPTNPSTTWPAIPGGTTSAGRPSDALAAWAVPLAIKLSIPAVALQAYAYAELSLEHVTPTCKISWTTLAAIGKMESDHGRGNGAKLTTDGKALPPIIGIALNGASGTDAIADTDGGEFDKDPTWDHAVGPMQFIPSTWKQYAVDADLDGKQDPNDIDDASLAAAAYLCSKGQDMSTKTGWDSAILTYNAVRAYANDVYAIANDYGVRSKA